MPVPTIAIRFMLEVYNNFMTIKVISLNIWCGGKLMPALVDFLRAQDADILALQEVYNGQDPALPDHYRSMESLKARLWEYRFTDFAEAYQETITSGKVSHGNAVFSKFRITASSVSFMADPVSVDFEYHDIPEHWPLLPAPLQLTEIDALGQKINIFNLHGVWDLDGDNYSERRQRMSQVILAETSGLSNVILVGDTNAKPTNQAMRDLEAQLKPVFGDELITTFNLKHKTNPGYATAAVDLMYLSPEIEVVSRDCPDVDISDHRPLVVELSIPDLE